MKRNIKANKASQVPSPDPLKSSEREFGEVMEAMVELISRIYQNQVLEELNKSTVEKFADAQRGNFATIFTSLSKKVRRKLLKRFSNKRLRKVAEEFLGNVNKRNQQTLYNRIEDKIGIDSRQLAATEGLKPTTNALIEETVQWVQKLRDETIETYTNNSLRMMTQGRTMDEILAEFKEQREKRKDHAKFVARNQINNFNSMMTKIRSQNLGIDKAVWVTAGDESVRTCHKARDEKEFDLSEGLYSSCDGKTLYPGTDYQCRCTYRLVIPEDDE